jgi:hypothetical protein
MFVTNTAEATRVTPRLHRAASNCATISARPWSSGPCYRLEGRGKTCRPCSSRHSFAQPISDRSKSHRFRPLDGRRPNADRQGLDAMWHRRGSRCRTAALNRHESPLQRDGTDHRSGAATTMTSAVDERASVLSASFVTSRFATKTRRHEEIPCFLDLRAFMPSWRYCRNEKDGPLAVERSFACLRPHQWIRCSTGRAVVCR